MNETTFSKYSGVTEVKRCNEKLYVVVNKFSIELQLYNIFETKANMKIKTEINVVGE